MPCQVQFDLECWKEHTCLQCGSSFRYLFRRHKKAVGATPDLAQQELESALVRSLQTECDPVACPECGWFQPGMIADRLRHFYSKLLRLELLGLAGLAFVGVVGGSLLLACALIPFGLGCIGIMVHRMYKDPNNNLVRNRAESNMKVQAGTLSWRTRPHGYAPTEEPWLPPHLSYKPYLATLATGALALGLPLFLSTSAWQTWAAGCIGAACILGTTLGLRARTPALASHDHPTRVYPKEDEIESSKVSNASLEEALA